MDGLINWLLLRRLLGCMIGIFLGIRNENMEIATSLTFRVELYNVDWPDLAPTAFMSAINLSFNVKDPFL